MIEVIDSPDDYNDHDNEKYKSDKSSEDPELIKRRAKLLEAEREMTKRKVLAREELEARRELRREKTSQSRSPHAHKRKSHHKSHHKRNQSPGEHSVIQLSESEDDDDKRYVLYHARLSFYQFDINSYLIPVCSSGRDDDDDENDTASDSASNTKSNDSRSDEQSDYEIPTSPLSVGELTKSEHRRRRSRSRSKSRSKSHSTSRSRSPSRSQSHSRSRSHSTSRDSRSE